MLPSTNASRIRECDGEIAGIRVFVLPQAFVDGMAEYRVTTST